MSALSMGIDVGGTKLEALVLDAHGQERWRQRVATPAGDYAATVAAIAALADAGRTAVGTHALSIGLGTPGALTAAGVMKNCNSNCLNGQPFQRDLETALGQPVALANDANCLALSEATDGAGAGASVVFAAILGTGVGAGIAVGGRVLNGPNRLAGEWGHNPLPWALADDPLPACYCGQRGCIENALCGPAIAADHLARHGQGLTAKDIAERAPSDTACADSIACWHHRLARALAHVVNLLDPDVIVLGGGLSRIASSYSVLPELLPRWVFCGGAQDLVLTHVAPARHGDSSGVRGAAWLGRQAAAARA
ncbi:transcriptional regulator/sugar kinase [Burkholderiales bacterium JOSHI_001]|nr:transcriptional regulator/sugar kinase [Burkholderiales bacterium JOSHI_001]